MYEVIFESETSAGWFFDVGLLIAILSSVVMVSVETIPSIAARNWMILTALEWLLTVLFTIEYVARLISSRRPLRYAFSFWGVIDFLSVLPTYLVLFLPETQAESFVIIRSIRLLRAFRVLKLWRMTSDAEELSHVIWKTRHKIAVFLTVVLVAVTISGTLMYFVENVVPTLIAMQRPGGEASQLPNSQFDSIPQSMYWAIVTMTTVGYGDIVPKTTAGKFVSAALILLGYSLIIVPTGFVTAELTSRIGDTNAMAVETHCPRCDTAGHRGDAAYCYRCGERFEKT